MKRYIEVIAIVPLLEEFQTFSEYFNIIEDVSTENDLRFIAETPGGVNVLLIKQDIMGRTSTQNAVTAALNDFSTSIAVCAGIAGGLSSDVKIGDICYSTSIIDVLDNAKFKSKGNKSVYSFSPSIYNTERALRVAFTRDRISLDTKDKFHEWQKLRGTEARTLIPQPFHGRGGKLEHVSDPNIHEGAIACAAVSDDTNYNDKLKNIDRKVLAIETESGGLYAAAEQHAIPAISIRGISDYAGAGVDKTRFEEETENKARKLAAANAASYLIHITDSSFIVQFINKTRIKLSGAALEKSLAVITPDDFQSHIDNQAKILNEKLRDLSPSYALLRQGYKLPIPRIREINVRGGLASSHSADPIEIIDGLSKVKVVNIHVPQHYPDLALAWIIADNLIACKLGDKIVVPYVIDGHRISPPSNGIVSQCGDDFGRLTIRGDTKIVIIINDFSFSSKTKTAFLLKEIDNHPDFSFVILTQNKENIIPETEFALKVNSIAANVVDISFVEIAYFLQKNFEMTGPASEVVASRLRETFQKFKLPAHPTYFAGIPQNAIDALWKANKRAELIEIAVAGYLSYVVVKDNDLVPLSRTTREQFLAEFAFETKYAGKSYTEAELVIFADKLRIDYDYPISPARFVALFIDKGILHNRKGKIEFTLPFVESYLLAKKLVKQSDDARTYFDYRKTEFDFATFALYSEIGASGSVLADIDASLELMIEEFTREISKDTVLIESNAPKLLDRQDRLRSLQKKLEKTTNDVIEDRDEVQAKQKLLDATDRIREGAFQQSSELTDARAGGTIAPISLEGEAITVWQIAITLLGSGSERLKAENKRDFIKKIIHLTALLLNDWTHAHCTVDFEKLKSDLISSEEFRDALNKLSGQPTIIETIKSFEGFVDLLEYDFVTMPFLQMMGILCEEARDKVLAESIVNVDCEDGLQSLIRGLWLSDIDVDQGKTDLLKSIKNLPGARFVRVMAATHLIARVYWKQWNKHDRLTLLDAADASLKAVGATYDKSKLKRLIENEKNEGEHE